MTSTTSADVRAASAVITVALMGPATPRPAALRAALASLPADTSASWRLVAADSVPVGMTVDIAVCDTPVAATAALRRWPVAAVIALVHGRDDGSTVVAALEGGAHVCVRGGDDAVIAAYLRAVARRRGLVSHEVQR